jgi:hypothetical protein
MRMSMMRFSSNGVPANRTAFGKNSSIDGPWKPPSPGSAATTTNGERRREGAISADSDIGACGTRRSRGGFASA